MIGRQTLIKFSGATALAGATGVAPVNPYPFDPTRAKNYQQKLFIPGGSGPFGVMDVSGPLQIRATAASFPILKGPVSPFLLYQSERAGKAYQNPILRLESGAHFGHGRTVSDLGWKDTELVWPGETVKIAIDFSHDFVGSQTYLLHCHNLEHEDAGMMVNFRMNA